MDDMEGVLLLNVVGTIIRWDTLYPGFGNQAPQDRTVPEEKNLRSVRNKQPLLWAPKIFANSKACWGSSG